MATGSDFAWPSVTVKRGSTVVKGRSIVKCSWSDIMCRFCINFYVFGPFLYMFAAVFYKDTCLEFDVHVFGMQFFNDIHIYIVLFKPTYRPKIFDWAARETTNQFGMA